MDQTPANSTFVQSLAWENFQTPAAICKNQTLTAECDTLNIHGYVIMSPELLPCCLMALILGLTLAHKTLKMKTRNSLFYGITFAMIGVMMTDAGWNDCLLPNLFPNNKLIHLYYTLIDVGLTSTIGFLFLINGLLDAGVLSENSPVTWGIFGTGATAIFAGWAYSLEKGSTMGFVILYLGVVGIGCGTWTIVELTLIIKQKDWASFRWLIFAGLNGGFGFFSLMSGRIQLWLCENVGCHFATQFIWFLMTDTAMYFIYRYYKSRVKFQAKSMYVRPQDKEAFSVPWL